MVGTRQQFHTIPMEASMSKGQRGNKEAKKQKKVPSAVPPQVPTGVVIALPAATAERGKKR